MPMSASVRAGSVVACVAGERLILTTSGAAFHERTRTLLVADLHFEKGSAYARRGALLPPYDTRTTLRRLARLCADFDPAEVISLGDAFHDAGAEARMDGADADLLATLMSARRWIWVLGNHDPAPPARFAAAVEVERRLGGLLLRHEPAEAAAPGEVAGHLHPCARVNAERLTLRRRCFATDGARLIMPAFGAYAGGLNVLDAAFGPLFDDFTVFLLGGEGVYPFNRSVLLPDVRTPGRLFPKLKSQDAIRRIKAGTGRHARGQG